MNKKLKRILFISALLFPTIFTSAQQLTIDAKSLASEIKAKSVIVIDVMAVDAYSKQHIQGAINIPHKTLYKDGPVEGQIKDPTELAKIFGEKGVSNSSRIVLYDDGSQKYNSRVWWILKYIGATNVMLFHKDMAQLEASRIPLTATPSTIPATQFEVTIQPDMNIDMSALKSLTESGGYFLLDAREKDEFEGTDKAQKSKGHLPGAIFMNYKEVLTEKGAFKSKEEIIASASKLGINPDSKVVVYCQTGIKAAVVYVALKEIAGFSDVKLYAGAYAEWASVNGNPIVK